ncbi:MAG: 6,7-dimethyl-8-ribityllumazine synthase [Elusimicrobiales bacterium]|jgi:6,7-dimethyl-8-ribityllumazine synthase
MKIVEGRLTAEKLKFALVVSRFNDFLTAKLLEGALDALKRHGAREKSLTVVKVPGSYEIPLAVQKLAGKGFNAIIALGVIIKGDTPHFDYVAAETAKGIAQVSLACKIPVAFGIVTADTLEQAIERAGTKHGNKGADAAMSAMEMANLFKQL